MHLFRMGKTLVNMPSAQVFRLRELIDIENRRINTRSLAKCPQARLQLMGFSAGESLPTHLSAGDALAYVLEGDAEIVLGGTPHILETGQCLLMPANTPHSVRATSAFKMLLIILLPES